MKRALLIALPLIVVLLLVFQRPLTIAWYGMLMRSSQQKVYSNTPPSVVDILIYRAYGIRSSDPEDLYFLSRDKLIQLRYLSRRTFKVKHVGGSGATITPFEGLARKTFPTAVEACFVSYSRTQPPVFEVCDYSERIAEWSEFIDRYDVPDFQQVLAHQLEGSEP